MDLGSLRDGGRLMQVGTGPLPGLHLLTQHAEPAPARMPVPDYGHRLEFSVFPEPLRDPATSAVEPAILSEQGAMTSSWSRTTPTSRATSTAGRC